MSENQRVRLVSAEAAHKDTETRALALRMAGLSWDELAEFESDGSRSFSSAANARELAEAALERAGAGVDERALELARLDAIQRAFWRKALGGDATAAKVVLQVMAQRAKFVGEGEQTPAQVSPLEALRAARRA